MPCLLVACKNELDLAEVLEVEQGVEKLLLERGFSKSLEKELSSMGTLRVFLGNSGGIEHVSAYFLKHGAQFLHANFFGISTGLDREAAEQIAHPIGCFLHEKGYTHSPGFHILGDYF